MASTDATFDFNAYLTQGAAGLDAVFLANTGIDLDTRTMDFFGLNNAVFDDALNNGGGLYDITDVSTPCINPVSPGVYFFTYDEKAMMWSVVGIWLEAVVLQCMH
jgi:hypothetical protein